MKKSKFLGPDITTSEMSYDDMCDILGKPLADAIQEGRREKGPETYYVISKIDTDSGVITLTPTEKPRG